MEREEAVRVRHGCWVGRALKRAQHRRPEGLAVKLEHVRASDLSPAVSLVGLVRLEGESAVEQREAVVDLETSDRGFGCAPEPHERGRQQLFKLHLFPRPHQIGVVRSDSLGVVVRKERCVLVPPFSGPFDPSRERGVQPRPFRFRQARVRDLAGERVLDRILAVPRDRGAGPASDEVALLEDPQIRICALNEVVDGAGPEDPADHGRRLQGLFLGRFEQVDPGRDDCLDGVGNGEVRRQLRQVP